MNKFTDFLYDFCWKIRFTLKNIKIIEPLDSSKKCSEINDDWSNDTYNNPIYSWNICNIYHRNNH